MLNVNYKIDVLAINNISLYTNCIIMNNIDKLTWSDVKSTKFDLAILPWGTTEPHNLHLPYTTDNLLSRAISLDAATKAELRGVRSVVLPTIPLGSQNPGQTQLMFCLHTRMETQKAILQDIVASLHYQGIRRLLIINGHGGNVFTPFVRDLALDYKDFLIVTSDYFKLVDANVYFDEPGDHAGELETSLMLHYYPELVKPGEMYGKGESKQFSIRGLRNRSFWLPRNWKAVSADTGIGNPAAATAEKGKAYAEAVSQSIADFLYDFTNTDISNLYQ